MKSETMAKMNKIGMFRFDLVNNGKCLRHRYMRDMFAVAQSIHNKDIQSAQLIQLLVGDCLYIRKITHLTDTVTQHGHPVMHGFNRDHLHPIHKKGTVIYLMHHQRRYARIVVIEAIGEYAMNSLIGRRRSINIHIAERTEIINAHDMVNMFMRQQYGIDMPNPIGQCLLPEIRSQSIKTWTPSTSNKAEHLNLLSLGSEEVHTLQSQPIYGTPVEVPVPKNVIFTFFKIKKTAYSLFRTTVV